jgi:hypothetical protein
MSKLEWDKVGDRRYETGIDRGVLYMLDGRTIPWNGLTSVAENTDREVKSYYADGVKYLDRHIPGSFSAKLQAFTYPDELDELLGTSQFVPGVFIHDQRANPFHLSYRTHVGNDVDGIDHGYKLHILYNIMASLGSSAFDTVGENTAPKQFEWALTGTPSSMFGIRPTCHISIHSRSIDPGLLSSIEDLIYGTESINPVLPSLVDLLSQIEEVT